MSDLLAMQTVPPLAVTPDETVHARCWQVISGRLDAILDAFYRDIRKSTFAPDLDAQAMQRLKAKQKEHWRALFVSGTDDDYSKRIFRMHLKHREIGIPTAFFVSSYLFLLGRFHEAVFEEARSLAEAKVLISAIDTVVAVDVTRAIGVYCDAVVVD